MWQLLRSALNVLTCLLNNNLLVVGALCFQLSSSVCSYWFHSHMCKIHILILHFLMKHWKSLNMKHLMLQLLTVSTILLFWWPSSFLHTKVYKTLYVDMCGWLDNHKENLKQSKLKNIDLKNVETKRLPSSWLRNCCFRPRHLWALRELWGPRYFDLFS